jgi:uncharacterized protein YodC (DUF2158 family)
MNTIEGPKDMLPQLPENYHFATEEELDNLPKGALVTEKNKQASRWVNSTISVNSSVNDTDRDAYYYAIPNLPKQTTDAMQTKEQKLQKFLATHPLPDGYKLATEEELNSVPKGKMKILCGNNWENSIYMIGDCVLKTDRADNIYITPIVSVVADTPTKQNDLESAISRMEAILPGHLAGCLDTGHVFSLSALEKVKATLIAVAREGQPLWNPEVGDIVCLKSGGPEMTVMDPEENGEFWCSWFHDGNLSSQDFPKETLTFIRK